MRRGRRPYPDVLTPREREVLELVRAGMTNEQIASRLGISLAGARYHVSEILSKLGVQSRHEAAEWLARSEEQRASRGAGAVIPALGPLAAGLTPANRLVAGVVIGAGILSFVVLLATALMAGDGGGPTSPTPVAAQPTPPAPEHVAVDFSEPVLGARYVTVWELPDFVFDGRPIGSDASGAEAALPALIEATLEGDAAAVRQAGASRGIATLHDLAQEPELQVCQGKDLCFWTVPLAPAGEGGEYWAVVSGGHALVAPGSPFALESTLSDGSAARFAHFVAVYERSAGGTWSGELARVQLEDPRGDCCDLAGVSWSSGGQLLRGVGEALAGNDPAWSRLNAALAPGLDGVDWDETSMGVTALPTAGSGEGGASSRLVLQGAALMASYASVFYVLEFDAEPVSLEVQVSNLHRRWGGRLMDLDGDRLPEVLVNESDAFVFSGASGTEETFVRVLRWQDGRPVEVSFALPSGLPEGVGRDVERALSLVDGGLWTDAAVLLGDASAGAPASESLVWLARRVQLIALMRLLQAERQADRGEPSLRVPLLVMAGEYEAAVDLMRGYTPAELFGENPLVGTYGNQMSAVGLEYTERALAVVPDRAAVHAIRAWSFALALPPDLENAEAAMAEAARLRPDDPFYVAALGRLRDNAP